MKSKIFVVIAVLFLLLSGMLVAVGSEGEGEKSDEVSATPQSEPQSTGYLTGKVRDLNTFENVSGAAVEVNETGDSTTTDASGEFNITLQPGHYNITVTAPDYYPEYKEVSVTSGNETSNLIYLEEYTGTLEGTVTDKDTGEPIQYASVTPAGYMLGAMTDEDGYYNIENISIGEHSVVASTSGYENATKNVTIEKDEVSTLDFQLEKAEEVEKATVKGTIREQISEEPIEGATVKIENETTKSNSTGKYKIMVEPGEYTITYSKEGYRPFSTDETLEKGEIQTIKVWLENISNPIIKGTVEDQDSDEPIEGATVKISDKTATTTADGEFEITLEEPGEYTVEISKDGYKSYSSEETFQEIKVYEIDAVKLEPKAGTDGEEDGDGFPLLLIMILAVVLAVLLIGGIVFWMKSKEEEEEKVSPPGPQGYQRKGGGSGKRSRKPPGGVKGKTGGSMGAAAAPSSAGKRSQKSRRCPDCGGELRWIDEYERWYCDTCGEYK
ncbi:MAG: carboxypeptidase regulatory-like domain-containing protein [Candidatus Thermoplasmatota archaeon]